jgi:Glycosyl transferases group 1
MGPSSDNEIIITMSLEGHNREEEEAVSATQQQPFRSSGGGGGVVVRRPAAPATAAGTTTATTTTTNSKKKQQSRQRALHHHQHRLTLGMGAGAALVAAAICFYLIVRFLLLLFPDPLIGDRNNRSPLKDPLRMLPLPYEVPASIQALRDLYDPRHDPILDPSPRGRSSVDSSGTFAAAASGCASASFAHHRIPARVLLLTKRRPTLYFRQPHDDPSSLMSDELLNIVQVGLARSPCFSLLNFTVVPDLVLDEPHYELSNDLLVDSAEEEKHAPAAPLALPPPMVWIVDMRRYYLVRQPYRGFGGNYTILDELLVLVNNTRNRARQRVQQQHPHLRLRKLVVVLMDYRDYIPEVDLCRALPAVKQLVQLLGQGGGGHVRYVMQQTVRKRQWNSTLHFVDVGTMYDPRNVSECWGGRALLHVPYTVRDDVADAVLLLARMQSSTRPVLPTSLSPSTNRHLLQPIQDPTFFQSSPFWRHIDVAHMWEYDATCAASSSHAKRVRMPCELRNQVTLALHQHFVPPQYNVRTKIADSLGVRTEVQNEYVRTLVASKIVVVAQRDLWEDSYRLMEALVCGAMVLTDPMLTLPMGLVDRESIVIYQSLEDLPVLIDYYLRNDAERIKIARRGHHVALSLHRPHHWMERLFFGKVVTP